MIGAAEVARATPDGTTLLMSTMPTLGPGAPLINPRANFRALDDLSHVAHIGGPPNAFVVATTSKLQTFADLTRIAKDTPLSYGTAEVGTVGHLTAVYVAQQAKLNLTHVPYNGPMLGDIISGTVEIGSLTASTVMGQIDGGKLRALAVGLAPRLDFYFVASDQVGDVHNFGWDVFEGSAPFEDKPLTPAGTLVEPITEYTHDDGCSVTGGYVYRGAAVRRQAWGRYFYGDYCWARSGASRTWTARSTAAVIRTRCAA